MKKTQIKYLFAILFISLVSTIYVSAQAEQTVEIKNNSGEKRKICMYKGGESDNSLCINEKKAFSKLQFQVDSTGKYQRLDCTGIGENLTKFRGLKDPKTNQQYYYLTF